MRVKLFILSVAIGLSALFAGCAGFSPKPAIDLANRPETCTRFLMKLAKAVEEIGVSDAGTVQVPGFPYLRTSRFLGAMAETVNSDEQFADWLEQMKLQAALSLEKELHNLPTSAVEKLAAESAIPANRPALLKEISVCCGVLSGHDETLPEFRKAVLSAAHPPAEYSSTMRILGLYPLASLPVAYLTHKVRKKFTDWFETPLETLPVLGSLTAYQPEKSGASGQEVSRNVFQLTAENSLRMRLFDPGQVRKLAEAWAPTLIQDVSGPRDIPGKVEWKEGKVHIHTGAPSVYYYLSYAVLKQKPIVQINYVAWFSAREGPFAPWIERGPLDGITLRVSLDREGNPFMLDIMNSCGCYHLFIPRKERILERKDKALAIDAFVPQWLPEDLSVSSLQVRVNSGWHQVQRVLASNSPVSSTVAYRLIPYDELETLPHSDGRHESVFDARGIMKGSDRIEPFLLFSMGVPSVGSMRQRGHHAISLVGRDHFDAPELFENNFVFK